MDQSAEGEEEEYRHTNKEDGEEENIHAIGRRSLETPADGKSDGIEKVRNLYLCVNTPPPHPLQIDPLSSFEKRWDREGEERLLCTYYDKYFVLLSLRNAFDSPTMLVLLSLRNSFDSPTIGGIEKVRNAFDSPTIYIYI